MIKMVVIKVMILTLLPTLLTAEPSKQTLFGCNNDRVELQCSPGTHIDIVRANYGRFSLSICNSEAVSNLRTSCDSSHSTSNILRTRYAASDSFVEPVSS